MFQQPILCTPSHVSATPVWIHTSSKFCEWNYGLWCGAWKQHSFSLQWWWQKKQTVFFLANKSVDRMRIHIVIAYFFVDSTIVFDSGADVIFMLCIVTSCALMLILLTLLSFVAVHYYKDRRQPNDLNNTFASTTNLTEDQIYTTGIENPAAVHSGQKIERRSANGEIFYSNGDTAGHMRDLLQTRDNFGDERTNQHNNGIQYPALVHPSDIGLSRKKAGKPRRRSRRKKHLITIPEVIIETSTDNLDMSDFNPNPDCLYLNGESGRSMQETSFVYNPLVSEARGSENSVLSWEPQFELSPVQSSVNGTENQQRQISNVRAHFETTSGFQSKASDKKFRPEDRRQTTSFCNGHTLRKNAEKQKPNFKETGNEPRSNCNGFHEAATSSHPEDIWSHNINKDVHNSLNDILLEPPERYKDHSSPKHKRRTFQRNNNNNDERENTKHHPVQRSKSDDTSSKNEQNGKILSNHHINSKTTPNVEPHVRHFQKHHHAGHRTLDHARSRSKLKVKMQSQKKRSQSCPNSPLMDRNREADDVPLVTYIETHPKLYVRIQKDFGSIDHLDFTKYTDDGDWEMLTTFWTDTL